MNESWHRVKVERDTDIDDTDIDADMTREHIHTGAPAQKVQDHLRCHGRGIGAHPFHCDSVIGGKGKDRSTWDCRLHLTRDHHVARG